MYSLGASVEDWWITFRQTLEIHEEPELNIDIEISHQRGNLVYIP